MNRLFGLIIAIIASIGLTYAQENVELVIDEKDRNHGEYNFGGYILNLDDYQVKMPIWQLPKFELMSQYKTPDFLLGFPNNTPIYSYGNTTYGYNNPLNRTRWGVQNNIDGPMNSSSFRLNNGVQIITYGDYDSDGNKRKMPSAYPWEKNNFRGGFEIKSGNGKFGFRVEFDRRGANPYGPTW